MKLSTPGQMQILRNLLILLIIGVLGVGIGRPLYYARMRRMAETIRNECRMVEAAIDQYALDGSKCGAIILNWVDLTPYLKPGSYGPLENARTGDPLAKAASNLMRNGGKDSLGNSISIRWVQMPPEVSPKTKTALSAVGDNTFLGRYS